MDPTIVGCPTRVWPASGHRGRGHRGSHARTEPRCLCQQGHTPFSATQGTGCSRRRPAAALVVAGGTWRAPGGPLHALAAACRLDARTGAAWWARAGPQGQAVQASVVEQPRDLGHVPADERRVQTPGDSVWMALARLVRPRLGRPGEGSRPRDRPRIRRLMARVRRGAAPGPLVCGPDGGCAARRASRAPCRDPVQTGGQGRPRVRPWRHLYLAQVVKRSAQRRVGAGERRLGAGTPARVETLRRRSHGEGVLPTAGIARLKAPFRARLAALTRRGRGLARCRLTLQPGRARLGTGSNFGPPHARLGRLGSATTPALATGRTAQGWSVRELLADHVPSPRWTPPKQRGRPSQALKRLLEQWGGDHDSLGSYPTIHPRD
jgi:hypothetical protein